MIDGALLSALEGTFPMTLITVSKSGVPNITNLSKAWVIDPDHFAVANQLLHKSAVNLVENPLALLRATDPADFSSWEIEAAFIRSETEGSLFDRISDDLQIISWMAGASHVTPLRSAFVFQALAVRKCAEETVNDPLVDRRYANLLDSMAQMLNWHRSSCWLTRHRDEAPQLAASLGMLAVNGDTAEYDYMKRLAVLVHTKGTVVRLANVGSHLRYVHTIRAEADQQKQQQNAPPLTGDRAKELKASFLGIPLIASGHMIGVICCEATNSEADLFNRFDDTFVEQLGRKLGEAVAAAQSLPENDCKKLFRQAIERLTFQQAKAKDPFHTVLSAREQQVAVYVAKGMTNAEIAQALFISVRTVTTHLERIFQKLNVTTRAALTRYAVEHSLLQDLHIDIKNE